MTELSKVLSLLLIATLAVSGLFTILPVNAQTIPKPSVPQFTVKYFDRSYDIPPTYGIDQYTGKTVVTKTGEHVDNRTLVFTIKNQPFTPYNDSNGNYITTYYYFRYKGQYGTEWLYYPDLSHTYGYYTGIFPDISASKSLYTTITMPLSSLVNYPNDKPEIPTGVQTELQVQAIIGYLDIGSTGMLAGGFYGFTGERSDWSTTQTIFTTDGATSDFTPPTSTIAPESSPSPTVPEFSVITILPLFVVIPLIMALLLRKNRLSKGL
jgi:hypothetical protein